jgi:nitrogen fixation NifU-like protein
MFSVKVIEHFMNPQNVGEMSDADGEGVCGDPVCGDFLTVHIKVEQNILVDIKFQVFGCPSAIATSSMATVLAKGRSLDEVMQLKEEDVILALGGLPEEKQHCSNLGVQALHKAVHDYYKKGASCNEANS